MIQLKGCPRCRGDLYLNQDMYGKYLNCLQCGYTRDLTGQPGPVAQDRSAAVVPGEKKAA
jgi:hypothetical protein